MDGLNRALWLRVRQAVVERDRECTAAELDSTPCAGGLDVHHLEPDPESAYDPRNLILLCDRHHALVHGLRRKSAALRGA